MKIFISIVLWLFLLMISWPLAVLAIFLFPIVWLILLPFRIVGLTLDLVFKLVGAIVMFPFKVLAR